ncbi:response regulator aspartate phosphatase E [Bacillus pumilus]|nr:response regulator aspartate phosphatase E [Bacillus pumilus]
MVREINCLTVVAGNYMDLETRDKALTCFSLALEKAKVLGNKHIIFRQLYNVGICYQGLNEITKAVSYFHQAILEGEPIGEKLFQVYYELIRIHLNQKELIEGREFYEKAKEQLALHKDDLFLDMLKVLENLFFKSANLSEVLACLEKLESARGLPYMEDLALEAARFYTENGRVDESVKLYEKMIYAQKQIQRGDCLYEFL